MALGVHVVLQSSTVSADLSSRVSFVPTTDDTGLLSQYDDARVSSDSCSILVCNFPLCNPLLQSKQASRALGTPRQHSQLNLVFPERQAAPLRSLLGRTVAEGGFILERGLTGHLFLNLQVSFF